MADPRWPLGECPLTESLYRHRKPAAHSRPLQDPPKQPAGTGNADDDSQSRENDRVGSTGPDLRRKQAVADPDEREETEFGAPAPRDASDSEDQTSSAG